MEVLWTRDEGAKREETQCEPSNSGLLANGSVSREGEKQPSDPNRSFREGTTRVVSSEYEWAMSAREGSTPLERTCDQ